MHVKTQFSIKDLEHLSGVKAHTIRIWEKRYNLLQPHRTDTNIRYYDVESLKRLLNITFLYHEGIKISKIARYDTAQMKATIDRLAADRTESHAINAFKTAMFDFDVRGFSNAYQQLIKEQSFRAVFEHIFLPLLHDIGILWQTGAIDPAHERFISELIKQKVILQIEAKQQLPKAIHAPVFCLYLPYGEIHEIGLLYTYYELLNEGFSVVYLGANIPPKSLPYVLKHYENVIFVSYLTVQPQEQSVQEYVQSFQEEIKLGKHQKLWLMGGKINPLSKKDVPKHVQLIRNLSELETQLQTLKK